MRWWILAMLMGCSSGLQSTSAECKDGYERGEDGGCYAEDGDGENALPGGTGDGNDGDSDDDGPTGGDAGDVDEGAPADDPPGDDGGDDEFDDSCEAPEDCSMDRCPDGSMGCTCLIHHINGFVGHKSIVDILRCQFGSRSQSLISITKVVVLFKTRL